VQRQRFAQRSSRYGGPGKSSTSWGPLPDVDLPEDMDDEAGEAAAWRRWEREREIRERAMQAFVAAEKHEIEKMKEEMSSRHHYHNEQKRRMQAEWSRQRAEEDKQREQRELEDLTRAQVCLLPAVCSVLRSLTDTRSLSWRAGIDRRSSKVLAG
jgi:hypothetical protein